MSLNNITIHKGSQSLKGSMINTDYTPHLRATINRDAYDPQSWSDIEVWTTNGWTSIQRFPIGELRIKNYSYVSSGEDWKQAMKEDLTDLIKFGYDFLAVKPA
jgi:hypothetical protein